MVNIKMVKKLVFALFGVLATGMGYCAAMPVREQSFTAVGTATTVSISTSAWTKVPATSSLEGRTDVCVNLPNSASANMVGTISSNSTAPTEAITVRPIEVIKGNEDRCIPIGDGLYLYLLSLHTSAENAHVQERKR